MIESSPDAIVRAPWGKFTATGSCVVWCSSRRLCGVYLWGRPDAEETRTIMRLFDQYPRVMEAEFDIILDTRGVESVDGEALSVLTSWMWEHRVALLESPRMSSIIREGPTGFLLVGLMPTIANSRNFRVFTDQREAFRAVLGDAGTALADEVEEIATRVRGVPRELQAVRTLLASRLDATVEQAAKELHMSARSLQRVLGRNGTSFHDEVVSARMAKACELLLSTDLKIGAIAARIGISERAITLLFRSRTGMSPNEWRTKQAAQR